MEPTLSSPSHTPNIGPHILSTHLAVQKAIRLLLISLVVALISGFIFSWFEVYSPDFEEDIPNPYIIEPTMIASGLLGIVFYVVGLYNQSFLGQWCAHGFAFCQGIVIGGLSCYSWSIFPNIMMESCLLSSIAIGCTWVGYEREWLRPNLSFRRIIRVLVTSICLWYMYTFFAYFFWGIEFDLIYGNTWIGIGFSSVVAIIACLETLLCIEDIETYEKMGVSEHVEWFLAMELLAGILWVYIEIVVLCFKWHMKTEG